MNEIKQIYEYCKAQKKAQEQLMDAMVDNNSMFQYANGGDTALWAVIGFIETNFKDKIK